MIGLVAGEASGDLLGAQLMQTLLKYYPGLTFVGVGGPLMQQAGLQSIGDIETLSVMGFIEPLKQLPQILSLRKKLINYFLIHKPLCYIGIDAPDFNLGIEKKLKQNRIKTVHYVSPTIWAWRPNRIKKIKKAVDLMLLIFPFEKKIYDNYQLSACYIGHPLAEKFEYYADINTQAKKISEEKKQARDKLNILSDKSMIGLLPGSRASEIRYLAPNFFLTARWLLNKRSDLHFLVPCANMHRYNEIRAILEKYPDLKSKISLIQGQSVEVIQASDALMVTSGTATLQTALIKRPFIVCYKTGWFTYQLAKWLIKVKYIAMPNIIANKIIAPEYIQDKIKIEQMGRDLLNYLNTSGQHQAQLNDQIALHSTLRTDGQLRAAQHILDLIR